MNRFVSKKVLKLLTDPRHQIPTEEREEHDKPCVEEDAFHDQVVSDQVFQECLGSFECFDREVRGKHFGDQFRFESVLLRD